ncbi:MAG: hypothetical protein IPM29_01745 [Planctomycetes bacterium]|nr:hypothetical protein [Planctomycetota bacterium]
MALHDRARLLPLAVLAATALVYATGLGNGFVWIDHSEIAGATKVVTSWSELWRTFVTADNGAGYHRPVYDLIHTLDRALWGLDPLGFHLSSLALHVVNTGLFMAVLRRAGHGAGLAALGGMLFGLHPLHSAVAGLVHAKADLFGLCCGLLTVLCAQRLAAAGGARRGATFAFGVAAATLGMLTKELVFLLPVGIAAGSIAPSRRTLRPFATALLLAAAAVGALHVAATASIERVQSPLGLTERLATFQAVYLDGLSLLTWPARLTLADTVTRFAARPPWERVAISAGFVACVWAQFAAARRWPSLRVWIVTYNAALLPVAQLVPTLHFRADRYFYVSGLAVAGAVTEAVRLAGRAQLAGERARRLAAAVAVLVALAYGARILARLPKFHDDVTLFTHELAGTPDYLEGLSHLGRARERGGDLRGAERCYRACLAPDPARVSYVDRDAVVVNLTQNLLVQGRSTEALALAEAADAHLRSAAHRAELRYNRAVAAYNLGHDADAVPLLAEYRALHPDDPVCAFLLGMAAARCGQRDVARAALRAYLDSGHPDPARRAAAAAAWDRL